MTTRAAVGILVDDAGRLLFAQRSNRVQTFPGQWEFPGGALENNEDFEEGLRRELYEELGVTLHRKPQLLRTSRHFDDRGQEWLVRSYVCRYSGATPQPQEPEKCTQIAFCSPSAPPAPLIDAAKGDLSKYCHTMQDR